MFSFFSNCFLSLFCIFYMIYVHVDLKILLKIFNSRPIGSTWGKNGKIKCFVYELFSNQAIIFGQVKNELKHPKKCFYLTCFFEHTSVIINVFCTNNLFSIYHQWMPCCYLRPEDRLCSSVWFSAPAEGFAPETASSGPPASPELNTEQLNLSSLTWLWQHVWYKYVN